MTRLAYGSASDTGRVRSNNQDAALDFYTNKLGFAEMMRLDRDGRLWLVYLRITDDQFLEVFPEGEGERAEDGGAHGRQDQLGHPGEAEQVEQRSLL